MGVCALALPVALAAQTTTVTVRVVAHDAKIIGSDVGGARVTIRNAATGAVLAEGEQQGGTGDTRALVVEPRVRGASIYDAPGAARFTAALTIDTPTVVEVLAEGPLKYPQATRRGMKTVLLLPGVDVGGDGLVIELNGFIVELLEPGTTVDRAGRTPVRARIRMLCGCTFTTGGLWDPTRLSVTARIYDGVTLVREAPLVFTGAPNTWAGSIPTAGPVGASRASEPEHPHRGRSRRRASRRRRGRCRPPKLRRKRGPADSLGRGSQRTDQHAVLAEDRDQQAAPLRIPADVRG